MQIKSIFNEPSMLGEGPLWHPQEQVLYWVDIVKPALHRLDPKTNQHQMWMMPTEIGSVGLNSTGGLVAALRTGFANISLPDGEVSWIAELGEKCKDTMFNDGKCDRFGRFWAGTKDLKEESDIGSLYRLDSDGTVHEMAKGFTVTNGIAWSPDNKYLYVCNSPARIIYQYDFDSAQGTISNRQIFAKVPEEAGYPDGLTVDSEGYLWSAHWDGWRITRYAPNGEIASVIPMPVQRPTSVCFGGADLKTLYVTSARVRLTEAEIAKGPLAGNVFAIETATMGLLESPFG